MQIIFIVIQRIDFVRNLIYFGFYGDFQEGLNDAFTYALLALHLGLQGLVQF
jgi:hypothetical protein